MGENKKRMMEAINRNFEEGGVTMAEVWTGPHKELLKRIRREKKKGNVLRYVAVTDRESGQSTMLVWMTGMNVLLSISADSITSKSTTEC